MLIYTYLMVTNYFTSLVKREEGQGMAEYGLILAVVALAAILAFTFLGDQIDLLINDVGSRLVVPE